MPTKFWKPPACLHCRRETTLLSILPIIANIKKPEMFFNESTKTSKNNMFLSVVF